MFELKVEKATVWFGMRWFRDHIRQGSWLALVALAVNFAMAFGHIHASDVTDSGRAGLLVAAIAPVYGDRSHNHPTDNRSDDLCAICMAAAAMGTALAPTPSALSVEFADAAVDHAIEHTVVTPHAPRAAFQSRGPPIS